ncbi:MAG: FtsX-like permease family protein [Chloroflexi bacterium]|nr:FtsX-like permease family protein [Chloroflexota bacterium]MCL5275532.1 FtsX-like permease family protein [Chloroflexota bacterium]
MRLYLRLAWRNIWRHRRRTLIVVLSIGLTMAGMMMYDGIMNGFQDGIYANAVKVLGGNIQIHASGYSDQADQLPLLSIPNDQAVVAAALAQPGVQAAARRINTGGLATDREGAFPVTIIGIEPDKELPVSLIAQHVSAGRYLNPDDQDVIFIGQGLASAMDIKVGDRISLVGRATHEQMRNRTMTVVGIYDVGLTDIEKRTIYVSLKEAQDLYGLNGQSTEVVVTLRKLGEESAVMAALRPSLNGYEITPWQTNYPDLQQAVESKNGVMYIFSVIILFIVGIGILNLLLMAVYERTREIGLMGALGMKPRQISTLFILEGVMMGMVGVVFGVALGVLFNAMLGQVGLDYSQFTSVTEYTALISGKIYPTLGLENLPLRSLTVLIIAVLASFYPAREAAQSEPATALHYV